MKTTLNTGSVQIAQEWIVTKCKGKYPSVVTHLDIREGAIDLIFRNYDSSYFMINIIDHDDAALVKTSYISKRKYLSIKNNKI